jgi:hypothetical protein
LLQKQSADGSWRGNLGETVDTCFALFFLRRANLANDLTVTLRSTPESLERDLHAKDRDSVVKVQGPKTYTGDENGQTKKTQDVAGTGSHPSPVIPHPSAASPSPLPPNPSTEAARLAGQLAKASGAEQDRLLEKLRAGQGSAFTDALAASIPQLTGPTRTKARDALAERLARMSAATLGTKLQEKNAEVRRAAALACAMKKENDLVPKLINLLQDSEPRVMRAAHVALNQLTGQDFGPGPVASHQDQAQAAKLWKTWWEKHH